MKKRICLFSMIFMVLSIITGCSQNEASIENVSREKAKELIETEEVAVIDVRTQEEYNSGHIPGAHLLPLDQLHTQLDDLDKDQPYLIVCKTGNRSLQASQQLLDNGFKHIYNMENGMNAWSYEIEK